MKDSITSVRVAPLFAANPHFAALHSGFYAAVGFIINVTSLQ